MIKNLLRFLFVAVLIVVVIMILGNLLRPKFTTVEIKRSHAEILAAQERRTVIIDPNRPIILHKDVDYSKGRTDCMVPKK